MRFLPIAAVLSLTATGAAAQSSVFIEQIGSGNTATVTQRGDGNGRHGLGGRVRQEADDGSAQVFQDGPDNDFSIRQTGQGPHTAILTQTGADNRATFRQEDFGPNLAAVMQTGDGNSANVRQSGVAGGQGNSYGLTQDGDNNTASVEQEGDNNTSVQQQAGSNNAMAAQQLGDNNTLSQIQLGDGFTAATVIQNGDSALSITQTAMPPMSPGG